MLIVCPEVEADPALVETIAPTLAAVSCSCGFFLPSEAAHDYAVFRECLARGTFGMFRDNLAELLHLPPLDDALLFPRPKELRESRALNRNYRKLLCDRKLFDAFNEETIDDAICDLDQLYLVYDYVLDANTQHSALYRRRALHDLRKLIGYEAYYSGRLPPPVPLQHLPVEN